jgi:Zn-dependent protease
MDMDTLALLQRIVTYFVPFLFALCFHEYAHGWVAKLRGDNTAQMMGRLTMNPLAHMDFIGTLVLPMIAIIFPGGLFFGWAKPVPVNIRNLKTPKTDMFWIALAGPLSNVLLALVATLVLWIAKMTMAGSEYFQTVATLLNVFIGINLFLAVFNMIPLHPLDGGKVLARFLPAEINYRLEQNEHITSMILLVLFLAGAVSFLLYPAEIMRQFLLSVALG